MKTIISILYSPRIRIIGLLTVSVLAILFCCINLPIVYVGLIELIALAGCIAFFRKVNVTQFELFQYKPHWFWRICEWYWTIWFCFKTLPFMKWLGDCYPTLKYAYFVYPSIFKPITDFSISNFGKVIAVRYLSTIMLAPVVILTMPIIYYGFRWLFKQIAEFFQSFTKYEKYFLSISSSVLIAILFIVSSKTSYFVYPVDRELYISENAEVILFDFKKFEDKYEFDYLLYCDFFFNTDTAPLVSYHFYERSTDNCRHPFFFIVMIFFCPFFYPIGLLFSLFFHSFVYCIALGIAVVQIVLFILNGIFLNRLFMPLVNNTFSKVISVLYVCSFPVVFSFCPERLIFSVFFLVLAVYICLTDNTFLKSLLAQLGAIGTTSLALALLVLTNLFNRHYSRIIILFLVVLFALLYNKYELFHANSTFIQKNSSILLRSCSYFQFESSCLMLPYYNIIEKDVELTKTRYNGIRFMPKSIVVLSVPSSVDATSGFIVFLLCSISVWMFRHSKIVLLCYAWILLSVAIIGIVGFGNSECVLYCSYFSWAVIPLAMLPFYWLWQKYPRLPIPQALYIFAAYLAISNLYFIYQVVQVVSERYIVPPGM